MEVSAQVPGESPGMTAVGVVPVVVEASVISVVGSVDSVVASVVGGAVTTVVLDDVVSMA
jgi:hypothetical protein